MSERNTPEPRPANRRWVGPLLLVSLVVNFFLLAHVGVNAFHHFNRGEHRGSMMFGMPHGAVMRALSDEERQTFRQSMRPHGAGIVAHFGDIRAARLALSEAVAADPYDKQAAKQAFARVRAAMDGIASASQDMLIEAFGDLSPETRDRIAEELKRPPRHRWNRSRARETPAAN